MSPIRSTCSRCGEVESVNPDGTCLCGRVVESEEYDWLCLNPECGWKGDWPSFANPEIDPEETAYCPECGEPLTDPADAERVEQDVVRLKRYWRLP